MGKIGWWYALCAGGTEHGLSDNNIAAFSGTGMIVSYVKEMVQNSLDAKMPGAEGPVRVVFKVDKLPAKDPVIKQVHENITLCKEYWEGKGNRRMEEFAKEADRVFKGEYIPVIIASDYNTTGIPGAWREDDRSGTPWGAMAECEGYSNKPSETSGGSWGIGKTVAIAISSLNTFFCNSYCLDDVEKDGKTEKKDVRAFTGICRLATFKDKDGGKRENVGRYRYNDAEAKIWRPVWEDDHDAFAEKFHRDEYGTDVISLGFDEKKGWELEAAFGVIRGFFPAVISGELTVTIKGTKETIEVNKNTITRVADRIKETRTDRAARETFGMLEAFLNPDEVYDIRIFENKDGVLYIKATDEWMTGYGGFRSNGMFIRFFERRGAARKYSAVFMARKDRLDSRLRDTEPPEHNRWDPAYAKESAWDEKEAEWMLERVRSEVCKRIDEFVRVESTETLDAYGMAKYFPGVGDKNDPGDGTGKDILSPKFKVTKKQTRRKQTSNIELDGKKSEGNKVDLEAFINEPTGGIIDEHIRKPHKRITLINEEEGEEEGAARKTRGPQLIKITGDKILHLRTFMTQGGYRTAAGFKERHDRAYFSFFASGEDGRSDKLTLNSFYHNGKQVMIKGNTAGPVTVEAGERYIFEHSFKEAGRFKIKVSIEEEVL